jgi:hypothetical protein
VRTLAVALPPAVAGGPLKNLNACLWLLAEVERRQLTGQNWQPIVIFDEGLLQVQHRNLLLQDVHGNPIQLPCLPGPSLTLAQRQQIIAIALDRMPGTAAAEPALESLLAQPDVPYLQAAQDLWSRLLGFSAIVVQAKQRSEPMPNFDEILSLDALPECIWISNRNLQTLHEFNLAPADALLGEDHLKTILLGRPQNQLATAQAALAQSVESGLAQLKTAVELEAPRMLGGWSRLRRSIRKALKDFQRACERDQRNSRGIRTRRIHGLAQALRPHGKAQQDHLGLISAVALFQLQTDRLVEHRSVFHEIKEQGLVVVNPESGICT